MSLIVSGIRSVVRALAFDAGGPGFDTRQWVGKFGVRLRFFCVICRNVMSTVRRPSDQGVNWTPSPPPRHAGTTVPWMLTEPESE